MIKKNILLLLLGLTLNLVSGQTKIIDSLYKSLFNTTNDTLQLVLAQQLSYEWLNINSDSSLAYAEKYISLSRKMDYRLNVADGMGLKAFNYIYIGNYPRALETLFSAIKEAEDLQYNGPILSPVYLGMMQVPDHLHSFEKYRLYIQGKIHLVFWLLYYIKQSDKIAFQVQKIQEIGNAIKDDDLIASTLAWNGLTRMNSDPDSAIYYLSESIRLLQKTNKSKLLGPYTELLGQVYHAKGDHSSELNCMKQGLKYNLMTDNIRNSGFSYIKLADCFSESGQNDSVIIYAQKARNVAISGHYPDLEQFSVEKLTNFYEKLNQRDSAFKYQKLLVDIITRNSDAESIRQFENVQINKKLQENELLAAKQKYKDRVKLYGLLAGLLVLFIIAMILLWNNRIKKQANATLEKQKKEIETQKNKAEMALSELNATQAQLIQSEKMASLGELTAGIAHEIQNPLNFVNNFSEVSIEMIDELKQESVVGGQQSAVSSQQSAIEILDAIKQNLEKILLHGKRADGIVKGMLQHSRASSGQKEPTDINALVDEYLRLAYHGLRARDKSFNATIPTDFDTSIGTINVIPQDIGRVILNLITNAFYAVNEKKNRLAEDLSALPDLTGQNVFEPTVSVSTKKMGNHVLISVKDNGNGIPKKNLDKIFQPFFTTKPTGQGTGLGLSLSFDIVKAHGGELLVESNENEFTVFTISIPV